MLKKFNILLIYEWICLALGLGDDCLFHWDIYYLFISVINQLDAQMFCFTISLFHASTCFEHMCSKHVEAWNKLIVKQKFCASSWLITEINILRCTVSKTSKSVTWFLGGALNVYLSKYTVLSIIICRYQCQNWYFCLNRNM